MFLLWNVCFKFWNSNLKLNYISGENLDGKMWVHRKIINTFACEGKKSLWIWFFMILINVLNPRVSLCNSVEHCIRLVLWHNDLLVRKIKVLFSPLSSQLYRRIVFAWLPRGRKMSLIFEAKEISEIMRENPQHAETKRGKYDSAEGYKKSGKSILWKYAENGNLKNTERIIPPACTDPRGSRANGLKIFSGNLNKWRGLFKPSA